MQDERRPSRLLPDLPTTREQERLAGGRLPSRVAGEDVGAIRVSRLTKKGRKQLAEHLDIPFTEVDEKGKEVKRSLDQIFDDLPGSVSLLDLQQIPGFKASGFKPEFRKELRGREAISDKELVSAGALADIFNFDLSPEEAEERGLDPQQFAATPAERQAGQVAGLAEDALRQLSGGSALIEQGLAVQRGDFSSQAAQDALFATNELFGSQLATSGFGDSGLAAFQGTVLGRQALNQLATRDIATGQAVTQFGQGFLGFASPLSVPTARLAAEQERLDAQTFGSLFDFTVRSQSEAASQLQRQANLDTILAGIQTAGGAAGGTGQLVTAFT